MKVFAKRIRTLVVYVLLFHIVTKICDTFLPNAHWANRIRGALIGRFFRRTGKRIAIASGCIFNAPWNLVLGDDCYIAHRCWMNSVAGVTIGSGVIISPNVVIATTAHDRIYGAVSLRKSRQAPIQIGAGVWIASNSTITRGTNIGAGAVIGAGSVVIGDVNSNCLYAGNPATKIRDLSFR